MFAETRPWARLRLHPIFRSNEAARAAVRALALETSLGSYDFETGLRLANLLTGRRLATGPLPLWAWAVLVVGLVLGPGLAWAGQAPPFAPPGWDVALAYGGGLLALAGLFFYFLDARSLPRLLMPRLLGGIGIGFSALVIQSDPILLSNALWRGGGWAGVAAVWLAAWGVCALYGFSDIRPRVKSSRQVGKRVLALVVVFSLFALVAGLLILPFPTAAFYEKLWQPDWLWLGPTGWVSLPLWLAFSPLALLMGIFTQFLFEDKAVTVSSWPLETE